MERHLSEPRLFSEPQMFTTILSSELLLTQGGRNLAAIGLTKDIKDAALDRPIRPCRPARPSHLADPSLRSGISRDSIHTCRHRPVQARRFLAIEHDSPSQFNIMQLLAAVETRGVSRAILLVGVTDKEKFYVSANSGHYCMPSPRSLTSTGASGSTRLPTLWRFISGASCMIGPCLGL